MCRGARAPRGQSRRRSHPRARARSATRAPSLSPRSAPGVCGPFGLRAARGASGSRQRGTPSARRRPSCCAPGRPAGLGTVAGCRRAELADCSGKAKVRRVCVCEREREREREKETHLGTWVHLRCMVVRASVCPRVGPGAWFSAPVPFGRRFWWQGTTAGALE